MLKAVAPLLAALVVATPAAAPGTLDTSFGTHGTATIVVSRGNPSLIYAELDTALWSKGRIWLSGGASAAGPVRAGSAASLRYGPVLVRLLPDGRLDPSFGRGGIARLHEPSVGGMYLELGLPDGGAIVSQYSQSRPARRGLVRLRADGSVDRRFGHDGLARITQGSCDITPDRLVRQPDGRLVGLTRVCGAGKGEVWFALLRLLPNGRVDRSFGKGGIASVRLGTAPELAFAGPRQVVVAPDGSLVVAGTVSAGDEVNRIALVRFTATGRLDTRFGGNGVARLPPETADGFGLQAALLVRPDGRLLVAGSQYVGGPATKLVRLLPDGTPDLSWGRGGVVLVPGIYWQGRWNQRNVLAAPHGKLVVVADDRFERLNADGSLDTAFGTGGVVKTTFFPDTTVVVQPDGRVVYATKIRPTEQRRAFQLQRWLG